MKNFKNQTPTIINRKTSSSFMPQLLIKFAHHPLSRLRQFNNLLKNGEYYSKRVTARLLDSPTSRSYHHARWLDPQDDLYAEQLERKVLSLPGKGVRVIMWEPHYNNPELPILLKKIGYLGKLYLFGPPGQKVYEYSKDGLIDGNYVELEDAISAMKKSSFWI